MAYILWNLVQFCLCNIMLNVCCIQLTVQRVSNLQDVEDISDDSHLQFTL